MTKKKTNILFINGHLKPDAKAQLTHKNINLLKFSPLKHENPMPSLLVIRLHPIEPVTGDEFTNYLTGLSITAHDLSFTDPTGAATPALGPATYIAPTTLPPSPSPDPVPVQDPDTRIVQHFSIDPGGLPGDFVRNFSAVATSVIQIPDPPAGGEYRTADVRLVITRNGNQINKQ